jgi:hypothetical protein
MMDGCPYGCGSFRSVVAFDHTERPNVGDFTVCSTCRRVLVFASIHPLKHRKPSPYELREAAKLPGVARAILALSLAKGEL